MSGQMSISLENNQAYDIPFITDEQVKSHIFLEVFKKAFNCLGDIVNATERLRGTPLGHFHDIIELNNIIVFTGDRGTGKTTAMINFVSAVSNSNRLSTWKSHLQDVERGIKPLQKGVFYSLPVIDPSKLSDSGSLIGVIVARIYEQISGIRDEGDGFRRELIRNAYEKCETAFVAIQAAHQTPSGIDDYEHLAMSASSTGIRKCLHNLFIAYLRLTDHIQRNTRYQQDTDECFLIIPIDDLDTNIRMGYRIAEEIRSFLLLPNVVIPMAVKLAQLTDLIEQQFMTDFGVMRQQSNLLDAEPSEMAIKYIDKLVPIARRLKIPELNTRTISNLEITRTDRQSTPIHVIDYFFKLIFDKTGILLCKSTHGSHPLFPYNLRAISQLVGVLETLPSIEFVFSESSTAENDSNKDRCSLASSAKANLSSNLNIVEDWILDSVCSNSVPRGLASIACHVARHPSYGMNAYLVRQLEQYGITENHQIIKPSPNAGPSFYGLYGMSPEVLSITNPENHPNNVSLGDVMYVLQKIQKVNSSEGIRHFVAAITMLYSLRLTRLLYCDEEIKYKEIQTILGGLIYHPSVQLSPGGLEWMLEVNTRSAGLRLAKDLSPVSIGNPSETFNSPYESMSLEQASWLSFFIIAYRTHYIGSLHGFKDTDYTATKFPVRYSSLRDDLVPILSINWLGFLTSALTPQETVQRLLGPYVVSQQNLFADRVDAWQQAWHTALPVNSVEVMNRLIRYLHEHRFDWKQTGIGKDEGVPNPPIAEMNNFFHIRSALTSGLERTLQNTVLRCPAIINSNAPEAYKAEKETYRNFEDYLTKALETCPLMDTKNDIVGPYFGEKKTGTFFDWFLYL